MSLLSHRVGYPGKRFFDVAFALGVLVLASPVLLVALCAVWLQDFASPFYRAPRVAKGGGDFTMLKIRSMVVNADASGVSSTGANDRRVTAVGRAIRRWKIDELSQFLNVIGGTMSVVGPRPQVRAWGTDLYTVEERHLLSVRPGITDLSSIVFSDEGEILAGSEHADLDYNRLIRPWKSRLGLFYIKHMSVLLDLRIIALTAVAIVNRAAALRGVTSILEEYDADEHLVAACRRRNPLEPYPAPGAQTIEEGLAQRAHWV